VHGLAPEDVEYEEGFAALQKVWVAVRTSLRSVLESVTIADLAGGALPPAIEGLTVEPDSWARR
jgi:DNA-binding IscR family transcriptional regulator